MNNNHTNKAINITMLLRFLLGAIAVSIPSTLAAPTQHTLYFSCANLHQRFQEITDLSPAEVFISEHTISAKSPNKNNALLEFVSEMDQCMKSVAILIVTGCSTDDEYTWIRLITSLKSVEKLEFNGTNIEELNFEWIASKYLSELHFIRNKLTTNKVRNKLKLTGRAEAISVMYLEKFSCIDCNLSDSDLNVLKHLKSLENLDLSGNDIDESYVLEVLPQVKILNSKTRTQIMNEKSSVKSNSFKSEPCYLIVLLSVALFRDKFSCLIVFILLISIANAQSTALKLQDINTTELKEDFFDVNNYSINFTSITIRSSNIYYVEYSTFRRFKNLRCLNLVGNQLTSFHIQRNNLKVLDLSDNQITSIDARLFVNSPDLQELHLNGNQLSSIDWDLSFHAAIHKVYLNHNQLDAMHIISPTIVEICLVQNIFSLLYNIFFK